MFGINASTRDESVPWGVLSKKSKVPTKALRTLCSRLLLLLLLLLLQASEESVGPEFFYTVTGTQHAACTHGIGRFGTAR